MVRLDIVGFECCRKVPNMLLEKQLFQRFIGRKAVAKLIQGVFAKVVHIAL